MKKIKFACNLSLLTLFALGQWACEWDPYEHDSDPVRETLELTASASQIALDENDLSATVLTFDWTPARPMPDEYLVSYTTKLDLLNNNFGSSTAIVTSEDDGIFSRSYTSEQINNWANERWKVPVNKTFTLAFRVIAEYAGGPTYEMPEVRTVEVTVTPIKVDVFDADKVSLSGTAISSVTEIEKTVENANLYAWYGELSIGELQTIFSSTARPPTMRPRWRRWALQMRSSFPSSWRVRPTTSFRATATARSATGSLST